jgi:hypothetical protein
MKTTTVLLLLQRLPVKIVDCTRISFLFPTLSEQTTIKVKSKRGVTKLKGILKNHCMTIPTVSPFDPWCVLDTICKPIFATYRELNAEKQALLNTPGGVFKNKGLPYAFHIHHRNAVPVDEPVSLHWGLNQTKQ